MQTSAVMHAIITCNFACQVNLSGFNVFRISDKLFDSDAFKRMMFNITYFCHFGNR